jgi:type I restriction enzyme, S subunit
VNSIRLRYVLRERDVRGYDGETVLSIYRDLGVVPKAERGDNFNKTPEDLSNYKLVLPGDVVVNKMKAWQGSVAVSSFRGIVSGDYLVCALIAQVDRSYLHHLLRSHALIKEYGARAKGIRPQQWRLYWEDLADISVLMPPLLEQTRIGRFLDAETARIEELITKKRRLVALLEERVENLVRQRIADSGLVASRPCTSIRPLKRLLMKVNRPAIQGGSMVTAFRDGQVTARALRRAEGYTESWSDNLHVQGVRKGDVVIHGLDGFAGAIGVSEVDGVCSPVYHVCTPNGQGDAVYLARMLRILAVSGYLGLFASSTRERAVDFRNWDLFGRIPIPEVDAPEQREIAHLIRRIRPLKTAVEQSAGLANERRQALITAAVSGQLDIPGTAA